MLKTYLTRLHDIAIRGDAREESFYAPLSELLGAYAKMAGLSKIHITTLPKQTEAGNPDFRVWDGKQHIVGYIEAKEPNVEYLDRVETSAQLKRYRHTFPNLLLTNFFEFRLYRNGVLIDKVSVGRPFFLNQIKVVPPVENEEQFLGLLEKFFSFSLSRVHDAKSLAVELAKRTRFLKDEVVAEELREEASGKRGFILGFYEAFRTYLISGLTHEEFADLYSQTIAYGLFAARTRAEGEFSRRIAYDNIPQTIGILRDVFRFISLGDLPKPMEWIVDDIAEVLDVTDVKKILHRFFHEGKGKDPIVHFYETFLAEYDPKTRERRGVYYTPEPVVSYIVRSLHLLLKEEFNRADGLATESVTALDPAAGTLTFLAEASSLAVQEFTAKYGSGAREEFIRGHILQNFYAFELMMAPYAIGHLKMSFLLEELGYRLAEDERCKLYLTNTLDMKELEQTPLPGMASLSEESHLAGKVKKEQPILVIFGNPPYSGHSTNVYEEVRAYYQMDGKSLGEKNPKWLQNDYVKFIRFAQVKIEQAGEGLLGFITDNSYLDSPTFRGMRRSLMQSFNEIYLLDLHGNSNKKERCPDGSEDKNVFDIMQGVAIILCVKRKGDASEAKVRHAELWGRREEKYGRLSLDDVGSTPWRELTPKADSYPFVPRDERLSEQFGKWPKIADIFPVNSVGIVTARDSLTIKWNRNEVWTTVLNFTKLDAETARLGYDLGPDTRDWKVELAQKDLLKEGLNKEKIAPILYRPFDCRYTYYTGRSRGFHCMPRSEVMRHMLKKNLGLVVPKQAKEDFGALVADCISGHKSVAAYDINYLFPLYLYPEDKEADSCREQPTLYAEEKPNGPRPNIDETFYRKLSEAYGVKPAPEELLLYIYAILYANSYRTRYSEFLKLDFPRIPFTTDYHLFRTLAGLGERLAALHLMTSPQLDLPVAKFEGEGESKLDKPRYDAETRRVYINAGRWFEGVAPEVWDYRIGGYQVCDKWLKDRKGRVLQLDDIKHYCRVVTALSRTIEVQREIDGLYGEVEKITIQTLL
ncbi:MAG TPA: type ISP restriction/modification enzyme [Geobacteraceae bacterium]|nr:type ISP restriction/modification enzyme [Geobacteraceae bacterium]